MLPISRINADSGSVEPTSDLLLDFYAVLPVQVHYMRITRIPSPKLADSDTEAQSYSLKFEL